ncbi:MAG: hypothetical protein OEL89_05080 [Candidatus Peregrinibacteria bacterium]|nr:hypothetical protein [Candidatus Peregrinibacteria bacterium]
MTDKKDSKINTVKNGKKNKLLSTQRYLQFDSAHDDVLVLKNGGLRVILEVQAVNFNLKSEEEQNAIIMSYQRFLNSLNFPVQISIKSRKLDIDHYLDDLKTRKKKLDNELLKKQMTEYIEYVEKLVEYADIMEKKFYVTVTIDPLRAQKNSFFGDFFQYIRPDDKVIDIITRKREFKFLKKDLDSRVNVVKTSLENCGLAVNQLSTEKIIELFYNAYNPQLARNEKIEDIGDISVADPAENLISDNK